MTTKKANLDLTTINTAANYKMLNPLGGKGFCQTGAMSITREQMDQLIAALGGEPHNAVKASTKYLIVPNEPDFRKGSKYRAAVERGTVIITEQQFVELILPSVDELLGDGSGGSKA